MLGRWRTQQNAKHLEEERLNAERERSLSDAASPRSPDASVHSPPSTPASTAEPPATPTSAASGQPTPASTPAFTASDQPIVEPASTPASVANDQPLVEPASTTNDQPLVELATTPAAADHPEVQPASTAHDQLLAEPASTPTSDQPSPLALDASTRVQRGTPEASLHGAYDTPLSHAQHGPDPAVGADASAPGDAVRDTPTSATENAKGLEESEGASVAVEVTSSDQLDKLKTVMGTSVNNSQAGQMDAKEMIQVVEDSSKETAGKMKSKDSKRSKSERSAGVQNQEKSVDTLKISNGKSIEVVETAGGLHAKVEQKQNTLDGNGSGSSKNSANVGQQSFGAERNESSAPNNHTGWQACAPSQPDTVHCRFGLVMPAQYYVPPPQRPLNGAPRIQITSTSSRSESPFETVNYLSQSTLVHCAQRTYGAAKANRVTGCAVSVVEKGVRLVAAPVVAILRLWQAPLLCVDRVISQGARGVARAFTCAPRAEQVCCGLLGCECGIPITYMGDETEIGGKLKQQ